MNRFLYTELVTVPCYRRIMENSLNQIGQHFQIPGDYISGDAYGSGHINNTYAVIYSQSGKPVRYIHQKINDYVFKNPERLMDNVSRVIGHQYDKLKETGTSDLKRSCLRIVPAIDGKYFWIDEDGKYWRTYFFIEGAHTYDIVKSPDQAREAAAAFGRFQKTLIDLKGEKLWEILPGFHDTEKRFNAFEQAVEKDVLNRARDCKREIDFAITYEPIISVLAHLIGQGKLPERISHNDSKLNNVMFDDQTQKGLCVIDLDTVMPGSVIYDFGDLVRTAVSPAAEDEKNLSRIIFQIRMFEALSEGYLSEANSFLNATERDHLVFSGKLITFETGLRFLSDYLNGDIYFRTKTIDHNLVRCRSQFKLIEAIEENEDAMHRVIEKYT